MKIAVQIEGTKRNNIGDVFQAMAVVDHLPHVDLYLDRENLLSAANEGPILLFANGWYMHDYSAFPPPDNIIPVYASVHFSGSQILSSERNREHFRKYGPVGARDYKTLYMLRAAGIPSYFSGCFTLGLKRRPEDGRKRRLLVVDGVDHPLGSETLQRLSSVFACEAEHLSNDPLNEDGGFDSYTISALKQAEHILSTYCAATHVVTTKIHCALPCMAMGVPVTLLHPHPKEERLAPARRFLEVYSTGRIERISRDPMTRATVHRIDKARAWIREFIDEAAAQGGNPAKHAQKYAMLATRARVGTWLTQKGLYAAYRCGFSTDRLGKIFEPE
jgi:hypothetical protein